MTSWVTCLCGQWQYILCSVFVEWYSAFFFLLYHKAFICTLLSLRICSVITSDCLYQQLWGCRPTQVSASKYARGMDSPCLACYFCSEKGHFYGNLSTNGEVWLPAHTEILRDSLEAEVGLNTSFRGTGLLGVRSPCLKVPVIDHMCSHTL